MTIDERIEALTMNLELQAHESAKHDKQIEQLKGIAETTLDSIKRLERIALSHETRITQIEDRQ